MKFERIGNIAKFINGAPFKPEDWHGTGMNIIRIQNLTDPTKPYNKTNRKVDDKYIVKKHDVLVSWSATIDVFIWDDEDALLNQHIFKVIFDKTKVEKAYFILALKQTINELTKFAHGSTMKHVAKGDFDNHKIPLPSLSNQLHIAKILSQVENLIAQRKESIRLLDEFLKSTFLEMFGDSTRNDRGWKEISLVEACSNKNDIKCGPFGTQLGKSEYQLDGVPVWGISQINSLFRILPKDFVTQSKALELEEYSVIPFDIIMSRKGNVGKCSLFPEVLSKGIIHSDVLRIRIDKAKMQPIFLLFQLKFSKQVETQINGVSKGAIMAGVNVGKLKHIKIQQPPFDLQTRFTKTVEKTETLKAQYQSSLQELENLYGSLSQRAFKGELTGKDEELLMAAEPTAEYKPGP